jgi:hypothetical protein
MLELTMAAPSSYQIPTIFFYQLNHFPNFQADPLPLEASEVLSQALMNAISFAFAKRCRRLVYAKRIRSKTAQLPTPDRSSATFIPTTHNSSQRQ